MPSMPSANLNGEGAMATVDVLGEEMQDAGKGRGGGRAVPRSARYHRIASHSMPTSPSNPPCSGSRSMRRCAAITSGPSFARLPNLDNFVRIDMEDHTCTDATLAHLPPAPRGESATWASSCRPISTAPSDINDLLAARAQHPAVQGDLPRIRDHCLEAVRDRSRQFHLHHGEAARGRRLCRHRDPRHPSGVGGNGSGGPIWASSTKDYEFQMLLGVDPELRRIILDQGSPAAGLCSLRTRLVSLFHAPSSGKPDGRASCDPRDARSRPEVSPVGPR